MLLSILRLTCSDKPLVKMQVSAGLDNGKLLISVQRRLKKLLNVYRQFVRSSARSFCDLNHSKVPDMSLKSL